MKKPKDRVNRLQTRKQELLGKIKALRASPVRNVEHKIDRLNDQVLRIGERIIKVKEASNANS